MNILGISCYYHDSSACLIKNDEVLAGAQEERFTRVKHDNSFPKKAIDYCLRNSNLAINDLDAIVFYEKPIVKFERVFSQYVASFPKGLVSFLDTIPSWLKLKLRIRETLKEDLNYHGKVYFVDHHYSHIAASYFSSQFKEANFLTIDGVGEWATTTKGFAKNNKINLTHQINFPHSLGLFYSTLTAYLGFKVNNDEYKVMGLSAYGDSKPYYEKISKLINWHPEGSYSLNLEYFNFNSKNQMFSQKLIDLLGDSRKPESKMQKKYEDIAASVQKLLEETVFFMLNKMHEDNPQDNLILSGGVALNSVLNGKILKRTLYKDLYITPDPGDGGGALGAALAFYVDKTKKRPKLVSRTYLGPEFYWYQIKKELEKTKNIKFKFYKSNKELLNKTVELITKNKVIGWFQGRMEWGPRALGNRSIIAQATTKKMQDLINAKIKHREMFRPFAPVILKEKVKDYFDSKKSLVIDDYMLTVYPFKEKNKNKVPAVVHVDGTGRLQSIDQKINQKYYSLLNNYYKKTGVPILLNTSFNVRGEPIVCTPFDAIRCFLKTDIDYLIIDNYLVRKA